MSWSATGGVVVADTIPGEGAEMSIRQRALSHLRSRLYTDAGLEDLLGFGVFDLDRREVSKRVLTSRLYPPEESWTHRWSWWHVIPEVKIAGEGALVLLCESRSFEGFHILHVPRQWLRDHRDELAYQSAKEAFSLFLSAEPSDRFVERRGGGLDFGSWLFGP